MKLKKIFLNYCSFSYLQKVEITHFYCSNFSGVFWQDYLFFRYCVCSMAMIVSGQITSLKGLQPFHLFYILLFSLKSLKPFLSASLLLLYSVFVDIKAFKEDGKVKNTISSSF